MKCPYGLACRFLGTHRDVSGNSDGKGNSELNFFNKDTQRLLWKNKMTFVKADAKLKSLGLLVCLTAYYLFISMIVAFVLVRFSMRYELFFSVFSYNF